MESNLHKEARQVIHEYFYKRRTTVWPEDKIEISYDGIVQTEFGLIIPFRFITDVPVAPGGGRLLYDGLSGEYSPSYVGEPADEMIVGHLIHGKAFIVKSLERVKETALAIRKIARIDLKTSLAIANDSFMFSGRWDDIDCLRCVLDYFGLKTSIDVALEGQQRKFPESDLSKWRFYYHYPKLVGANLVARRFDPFLERGAVLYLF